MLPVFPTPHDDELLSHIAARYQDLRLLPTAHIALEHLFGKPVPKMAFDFPVGLDHLVSVLPVGHAYSAAYFISRSTLLPLHKPFLPPERITRLENAMKGKPSKTALTLTSSWSCRIRRPSFIMICPTCAGEEMVKFGHCYFHRVHQVSGVKVCPKHRCWLKATNVPTSLGRRLISAEKHIPPTMSEPIDENNLQDLDLLAFAQDAAWILDNDPGTMPSGTVRSKYIALLTERGFASKTGHVFSTKLIDAFKNRFSEEFLALFDSQLDSHDQRNWVARIVQANQIQHPTRHLLLMRFLDTTAKDFFNFRPSNTPFGKGPWQCPNPICTHFEQPVIHEVFLGITHNRKRRAMGTFVCRTCGYMYSRTEALDPHKPSLPTKVIAYGSSWDNRLQVLWFDRQIMLKDICGELHVGMDTIHRQAERLGLPESRLHADMTNKEAVENLTTLKECVKSARQKWTALLIEQPNAALEDLRKLKPDIYNVLSRFDIAWLDAHKPARKTNPTRRVDWNCWDEWLTVNAEHLAQTIKENPGKPIRVTLNSLAHQVQWKDGAIQRNKDKLPKAYPILRGLAESHEDFAIRRVWYIVRRFQQNNQPLTRSDLIKRAGLNPPVQTSKVLYEVDLALSQLVDAALFSRPP